MNAIILAAGMGTRLRPLTNEIPKCLVKVNGVPMVERQIQYLHDRGITDITLVSGYKSEKLDYLKEKYGVDIVFNNKYDVCNNIYSMYLVRDKFKDTYVIEGDVYMHKNCFTRDVSTSTYFSVWKEDYKNEWGLKIGENNQLQDIVIGDGRGYIMSGISYWNENDSKLVVREIERLILEEDYMNLFWDNAVINIYRKLYIIVRSICGIYEIDNSMDLQTVEYKCKE